MDQIIGITIVIVVCAVGRFAVKKLMVKTDNSLVIWFCSTAFAVCVLFGAFVVFLAQLPDVDPIALLLLVPLACGGVAAALESAICGWSMFRSGHHRAVCSQLLSMMALACLCFSLVAWFQYRQFRRWAKPPPSPIKVERSQNRARPIITPSTRLGG